MFTSLARALAGAALLAPLLVACGGGQDTAYVPAAFGEDGKCYYVESAEEVRALQDDDLCERSWQPTPAPPYWLFLYMPYFSSPAYTNTYVRSDRRDQWRSRSTTFARQNASQIKSAQATAKYRGSDGKTYTGTKVKPGQFGSGNKGFGNTRKCSIGVSDVRPLFGAALPLGASAPRPPAPARPAAPRQQSNPNKGSGGGNKKAPAGKTGGC